MFGLSTVKLVVYGLLIAAVLGIIGTYHVKLADAQTNLSNEQRDRAIEKTNAANAALKQTEEFRKRDALLRAEKDKVIADAQLEIESMRTDLAGYDASDARLRARLAALVAASRQARSDPQAGQGSSPATDATGMCADVLGQCITRVRVVATLADQRLIAGTTCERQYDSVESIASEPQP